MNNQPSARLRHGLLNCHAPPRVVPGILALIVLVFATACGATPPALAAELDECTPTSSLREELPLLAAEGSAHQWQPHQLILDAAEEYANPYIDVTVTAEFTGPDDQSMTVMGFWNGGSEFVVRFTPPTPGDWSYTVTSEPVDDGLSAGGEFIVEEAPASSPGFVRRDPQHPYHFVRDNGDRYFMMGQTYYDLLRTACANEAWHEGVVESAGYGINKIRIFVHSLGFGPDHRHPSYYPALHPFVDDDHDQISVEYWQQLDEVVLRLADEGVIADLILFMKPNNTEDDLAFGTLAQDERYTRYILARYAAFPNVIWCITNEWEYTGRDEAYWDNIGALVRSEDPWMEHGDALRALSIHNKTSGKEGGKFSFFTSDWPVHAIVQYGVRNERFKYGDQWAHTSIVQNWGHDMPVVNDEYGYIGEPTPIELTRAQHRAALWGLVSSGGYGAVGDFRTLEDGPNGKPGQIIMTGHWNPADEYKDIKTLVRFWTERGIPYWQMGPQQTVVGDTWRAYAVGIEGEEYVIYAAAGGKVKLALPAGEYEVRRFDPRIGSSAVQESVTGGKSTTITLPDDRDWVLHLTR